MRVTTSQGLKDYVYDLYRSGGMIPGRSVVYVVLLSGERRFGIFKGLEEGRLNYFMDSREYTITPVSWSSYADIEGFAVMDIREFIDLANAEFSTFDVKDTRNHWFVEGQK
jgi:hypothetical protein